MLVCFFFLIEQCFFSPSFPTGPYETLKENQRCLLKVDLSRGNGIARAVRIQTNLIKVLNCNTKAETLQGIIFISFYKNTALMHWTCRSSSPLLSIEISHPSYLIRAQVSSYVTVTACQSQGQNQARLVLFPLYIYANDGRRGASK